MLTKLVIPKSLQAMVVAVDLRWCVTEVLMESSELRWSARDVAFGSWMLLAGTAMVALD